MEHTITIFSSNEYYFNKKLVKLNKRAQKLNLPPITSQVVKTYYVEKQIKIDGGEATIKVEKKDILITGETPILDGYKVAGVVEYDGTNNFVTSFFDLPVPNTYRERKPYCDHCNSRRIKKKSYILIDQDGNYKQVGSGCLKSFVSASLTKILSFYDDLVENYFSDEEEKFSGGSQDWGMPTVEVLAVALDSYEKHGFTSKQEEGASTFSQVFSFFFGRGKDANYAKLELTEDRIQEAQKLITWINNNQSLTNEYWLNIKSITSMDSILVKRFGYLVSIVKSIYGTIEQEEAKQAGKTQEQEPETVLAEGRVPVTGEVVSKKIQYSDYGETLKMLIRLPDGNKIFGTVPAALGAVSRGDKVQFTATITRKEDHFGFFARPSKASYI